MDIKNSLRILIAEDDFLVSEEITRQIKKIGYIHVGTAPNGLKAIVMAKELKPDVILMDIKMPGLNGLEAAKIIQEEIPTPIVILTAHESQSLVEEAADSGIGAYLTKPPVAEQLERAITIASVRQTDLIESRKLIKALEKKELELREINEGKDKFFSIISHDLRNPVSALIGYSNIFVDSFYEMDDNEKFEICTSMKQLSENISSLLEGLLMWSRFEAGRMEFAPETFDIGLEVKEVVNLISPMAEAKEIGLNLEVENETYVWADKNMIKTIFRNLISNAIKFTLNNGQICISIKKISTNVEIIVEDNGIGMNEEYAENLFKINKLKSRNGTNNEKGTGLGLILCKELVEKNGGNLIVESKENSGSKFSFKLKSAKV